jgi:hypothetical protein
MATSHLDVGLVLQLPWNHRRCRVTPPLAKAVAVLLQHSISSAGKGLLGMLAILQDCGRQSIVLSSAR